MPSPAVLQTSDSTTLVVYLLETSAYALPGVSTASVVPYSARESLPPQIHPPGPPVMKLLLAAGPSA